VLEDQQKESIILCQITEQNIYDENKGEQTNDMKFYNQMDKENIFDEKMIKYYRKRYQFFSKYDEGI